jgi:hypothetical protein
MLDDDYGRLYTQNYLRREFDTIMLFCYNSYAGAAESSDEAAGARAVLWR